MMKMDRKISSRKVFIRSVVWVILLCGCSSNLNRNSTNQDGISESSSGKKAGPKYAIAPADYEGIPKGSGTWYDEPGIHEFTEIIYKGKLVKVAKGEINIKYKTGISMHQRDSLLVASGLYLQYRDEKWDYVKVTRSASLSFEKTI